MMYTMYRMYGRVRFDRPIDPEKHEITPGGYEAVFDDGRTLQFDFQDYEGNRDEDDDTILEWEQENPDTECFEEMKDFSYNDFAKHFERFEEFCIYTGEDGDAEIIPVEVLEVEIQFYNGKNFKTYRIPRFDAIVA